MDLYIFRRDNHTLYLFGRVFVYVYDNGDFYVHRQTFPLFDLKATNRSLFDRNIL